MNPINNKKSGKRFLIVNGLATALMLTISLIVLYFIVNATVRSVIYDNMIGKVQRDKQIYANEIDAWFDSAYSKVSTLAATLSALSYPQEFREPGFRDFDDRDRDFREIAERIVQENYYIVNVFIGFEDGSIINGAGFRPPQDSDWTATNLPWFSAAVEAGYGVIVMTEPYWSQAAETFTAGMATWLPELNNVGAVVGISVTQYNIFDRISHDPVWADGYRILATDTGTIVFHSDPAIRASENIRTLYCIPGGAGESMLATIQAGVIFDTFYGPRLGASYIVAAPLETVGWTLFDIVPVSAIRDPISQSITAIMVPLSVLIVVIFVFSLSLFYRISKQREDRLAQEKKLAEANSEAKSRFLTRMSHEIRTPITAVMGISEIQLQTPNLPPIIGESFAKIHNSSVLLLDNINDILDFSKIESGKVVIQSEKYDVASTISDVLNINATLIGNKDIKFHVHVDENMPVSLIGDALHVKQIINNLLSNALKYTESGSVDFFLYCEKDETREDGATLIITVQDTGLGMTEEQLDVLFIEYMRFHKQEMHHVSGSGLGMPIVNTLVQLMDAKLYIDSEVGKGTKVVVRIPQIISGSQTIGKEAATQLQHFGSYARFFSKKSTFKPEPMPYGSVLVVDDIETNHYVVRGLLAFYELNVESCNSGYEAIEKIKQGNVYDIVFMDFMMPGINGTETMRQIREMGYNHPIVALTANALIGQDKDFIKDGFDGFISKPIQTRHLNETLIKFIKDKQPHEVIEAARLASTDKSAPKGDINSFQSDPELVAKLRVDFKRSHHSTMERINEAIATGDSETAYRLVHTIKGSAGLIYEDVLVSAAKEVELVFAENGEPTVMQLTALEREIMRVLDDINDISSNPLDSEQMNTEDAVALLQQIIPLLTTRNASCVAMCDELRKVPHSTELVGQIENFQFSDAAKTATQLLTDLGVKYSD